MVPWIAHKTFHPLDLFLFVKELEVTGMGKGCGTVSRDAALLSNKFHSDYYSVERHLGFFSPLVSSMMIESDSNTTIISVEASMRWKSLSPTMRNT